MAPKKGSKVAFYAVKEGRVPGIYTTWAECEAQVKGHLNAKHKKFGTEQDARDFVEGRETPTVASSSSAATSKPASECKEKGKKRAAGSNLSEIANEAEWNVVYSDGACKGNGQPGSVAGIGVFWGPNDPRNIAERCPGDQTNNRAELIALLRVLETTPISTTPLLIKTDSIYSIRCMEQWLANWIKNGWVSSKGEPVKNAGIIRLISAHLDARAQQSQKVQLRHVKGHSGDPGNDGADAMANQGCLLPSVEERDWDVAEREIRERIRTYVRPVPARRIVSTRSPSREPDNVGLQAEPVALRSAVVPAKRQRTRSPERSSPLAFVPYVSPLSGLKSIPPKSPTPLLSPKRSTTRMAGVEQTVTTPTKSSMHRLALIQGALSSPVPGESSSVATAQLQTTPSRSSRMAAIESAFTSPMRAPQSRSPVNSPAKQDRLAAIRNALTQPAPPSAAASSSAYQPPARPSVNPLAVESRAKSPIRVLYVSPELLLSKPPPQEVDANDYASFLLSDDDLAKELED